MADHGKDRKEVYESPMANYRGERPERNDDWPTEPCYDDVASPIGVATRLSQYEDTQTGVGPSSLVSSTPRGQFGNRHLSGKADSGQLATSKSYQSGSPQHASWAGSNPAELDEFSKEVVSHSGTCDLKTHQTVNPEIAKTTLWLSILTNTSTEIFEHMVIEDTGTPYNWIHPKIVKRRGLRATTCPVKIFEDMQGNLFECNKEVKIRWAGKNDNIYDGIFLVGPSRSSISVVLGQDFVRGEGNAEDLCVEKTVESARVFMLKEMTNEEQDEMETSENNAKRVKDQLQKQKASKSRSQRPSKSSTNAREGDRSSGKK